MKKLYVTGWHTEKIIKNHFSESGKAFYLEVDTGYFGRGHEKYVWFPVSQCIFGEVNECGNYNISIPYWLVEKAGIRKDQVSRLDLEGAHLEMLEI
jgi:hypothetical protein